MQCRTVLELLLGIDIGSALDKHTNNSGSLCTLRPIASEIQRSVFPPISRVGVRPQMQKEFHCEKIPLASHLMQECAPIRVALLHEFRGGDKPLAYVIQQSSLIAAA
jgi:hypothetical protein